MVIDWNKEIRSSVSGVIVCFIRNVTFHYKGFLLFLQNLTYAQKKPGRDAEFCLSSLDTGT